VSASEVGSEVWTGAHRARREPRLKGLVTACAVEEIARRLEDGDPPASARRTPSRRVVAAIAWHLRVGGSWRALPDGFPPWRTAYGWFRRWLDLGLLDALLREVARRRRRKAGRRSGPTLGIVDAQVVKCCIGVRGPRGYDAAEGVVGRKRVALVDAEGCWLAVAVVPACVQGRDALPALDAGKARWPSLREGAYDGAFAADRCRAWSNLHGMRHRVVTRHPAAPGFVVLARRWAVERSFGWLSHWGGLAKDRAARLDVSAGRLATAAVLSGVEVLLNPLPMRNASN
jgi:putative transposase